VSEKPPLDGVVVVLDQTQDLVNIAGVVRVMMNMGLQHLRLVNPVEFDAWRIEGIAHRSGALIEATEHFDSLDDALADATWVVGTTGVGRTANRNWVRPRDVAPTLIEHAREGGRVALLFGREDWGLDNETLDRCHHVITIPTTPEYRSLNLAQAFLVVAYELFLAQGELDDLPVGRRAERPAEHHELESMYAALEIGLARIDFFKGTRPPESVLRALRTALGRAGLDRREAKLFEAIGYEIRNYMDRRGVSGPPGNPDPDSSSPSE
jgi:TrmH family RNA methyltransferase